MIGRYTTALTLMRLRARLGRAIALAGFEPATRESESHRIGRYPTGLKLEVKRMYAGAEASVQKVATAESLLLVVLFVILLALHARNAEERAAHAA